MRIRAVLAAALCAGAPLAAEPFRYSEAPLQQPPLMTPTEVAAGTARFYNEVDEKQTFLTEERKIHEPSFLSSTYASMNVRAAAFRTALVVLLLSAAGAHGEPKMQVTKPTDHETVLERTFDAPRERVFAALTQPDRITQWMGATGMALVGCEVDLRAGGRLRYIFKRPSGKTIEVRGEFEDVSPPQRLTYVETYDFSPLRILVTTTLEARGGRTLLKQTLRYASKQERDADFDGVATSSTEAWGNLERHLLTTFPPAG